MFNPTSRGTYAVGRSPLSPSPAAYERLAVSLEYAQDAYDLFITEEYRRVGTGDWRPRSAWESDEIDPEDNCTHLVVFDERIALDSERGQELLTLAQSNLKTIQHMLNRAPRVPIQPARWMLLALLLANSLGIYLILQRL